MKIVRTKRITEDINGSNKKPISYNDRAKKTNYGRFVNSNKKVSLRNQIPNKNQNIKEAPQSVIMFTQSSFANSELDKSNKNGKPIITSSEIKEPTNHLVIKESASDISTKNKNDLMLRQEAYSVIMMNNDPTSFKIDQNNTQKETNGLNNYLQLPNNHKETGTNENVITNNTEKKDIKILYPTKVQNNSDASSMKPSGINYESINSKDIKFSRPSNAFNNPAVTSSETEKKIPEITETKKNDPIERKDQLSSHTETKENKTNNKIEQSSYKSTFEISKDQTINKKIDRKSVV